MKTIEGEINFSGDKQIPENSIVEVNLLDVSIVDRASIILAHQFIKNPEKFPIKYTLSYDGKPFEKGVDGRYGLSVSIKTDNQLNYLTTSFHSIVDDQNELLENLNINIIKI